MASIVARAPSGRPAGVSWQASVMSELRPTGWTRRVLDLPRRSPEFADALVVAQGLAMAGLLWPGRGRWHLPRVVRTAALGVTAGGTAFGLAGLAQLGRHATPRVEPREGAPLRTGGLYAVSRNPVYAGLLVGAGGFALLRRRREPLLAVAGLAAVLHLKVLLEERRLRARFGPEYSAYARRTPRLIGLPRR
jgi:protein-S-isoprenylcysteine O-methyltransferase Ste14